MNRIEINVQTGEIASIPMTQEEIDALPPPQKQVPASVSDRQFFQQAALMGFITQEEALAAVSTGAIPATLSEAIGKMPDDNQFAAKMMVSDTTIFEHNHPLTLMFGELMGLNKDELDDLFIGASKL
jgi:hypothetical protein